MSFKKALDFYNQYFKSASKDSFFLCKADLIFRKYLIPNIELKKNIELKENKKKSFIIIFANLFLCVYSILNILKIKFKKISVAQYLIDIKNSSEPFDFRSKEILEILPSTETANFMHINNIRYSLFTFYKKPNAIYFESIYFIFKLFMKEPKYNYEHQDNSFVKKLIDVNKSYYSKSYNINKIVKIILNFLSIEKFIFLDDSRYSNELNLATKELEIESIGYMHGRFNEYHVGLFEYPFDKYLVWSEYFKKKLLDNTNKYKGNEIKIVGHFRIKEELRNVKKGNNLLWLGESNIDYNEMYPFIDLLVENGYNIIYRGKPGNDNEVLNYLKLQNIEIDKTQSFFESLKENKIGLVLGTHSTALMESWILGIPSLVIKNSYDYGRHLWIDNLIQLCEDKEELIVLVEKHLNFTDIEIEEIKKRIWGENYMFNEQMTRDIILGKND